MNQAISNEPNLQAFIDDSADETVFVLAGFVAPEDQWQKFNYLWQDALDSIPGVRRLKTREAMGLTGNFYRIPKEIRDEKMRLFYSIIDECVSFELSIAIPLEPFNRITKNESLPKAFCKPYYYALSWLISSTARHQTKIGMKEKIDFICDEQPKEQANILSIWEDLAANAPEDVKPMLGAPPAFKNDEQVLPLQAADMEAWWIRQRLKEKFTGIARREYPWQPAQIPALRHVLTEEEIQFQYGAILNTHKALGLII